MIDCPACRASRQAAELAPRTQDWFDGSHAHFGTLIRAALARGNHWHGRTE
jgi:hypothetical protein